MFEDVTADHVRKACMRVASRGVPPRRKGRSAFVRYRGEWLPAKYVLGLAQEAATGREPYPYEYEGGKAAAAVLRRLGFDVTVATPTDLIGKAGLFDALSRRFGAVEREKTFPWLIVPERTAVSDEIQRIRDVLVAYRGCAEFDTPGYALSCDYFIPSIQLILEVDERQHFTEARRIALGELVDADAPLGFDALEWIERCRRVRAVDNHPPYRDEQRAYYDSLRDSLSPRHGMLPVVRVHDSRLRFAAGIRSFVYDELGRRRR